jgi:hypothetical protein
VEIGRAKISIVNEQDSIGTFVYVAHEKGNGNAAANGQSIQWLSCELADGNYGSGTHGDHSKQLARIKIPDAFLRELQTVLVEGTTMVVTDAPILRKTTGKEMAVISSSPS